MIKAFRTTDRTDRIEQGRREYRTASLRRGCVLVLVGVLAGLSGCVHLNNWNPFRKTKSQLEPTADSLVLGTHGLLPEQVIGPPNPDLDKAKELFRQEKYSEARSLFHKVSHNKKSTPTQAEEALYCEAECLRLASQYPKAAEVYQQLLKEYPRRAHHRETLQRLFDIANYWLDETRGVMEAYADSQKKTNPLIQRVSLVHFDKTKPLLDMEGRALQLLETVYLNDIEGPLGERALFFLGSVHFFHNNYLEADHFFSQVVKFHPNGSFAPKALKLSIISKQLATGGSDYDGRKLAESRRLIQQASAAYPEIVNEDGEFLQRQIYAITMQQADADFGQAEFYRRVGHPGSAYFYYEIVRRRYPGTKYAEKAAEYMEEIRVQAERDKQRQANSWFPFFRSRTAADTGSNPSLPVSSPQEQPGRNGKQPGLDGSQAPNTEELPTPRTVTPPGQYPVPGTAPPNPAAPELAPAPRPLPPPTELPNLAPGPNGGAWPR